MAALKRAGSNYFVLQSDQKRSNGGLKHSTSSFSDRLNQMDILGESAYYVMGDNPNDPDVFNAHDQSGGAEGILGGFLDEGSIDYCCDILYRKFGFQLGSVDNQREHALLLLANAKSRERMNGGIDHVLLLHRKLVANYAEWCKFVEAEPVWYAGELNKRLTNRLHMELMLYLCIWGEAANVRHMPECICYLYHQMMLLLNGDLQVAQPFPERWYLDAVIRPIWSECAGMTTKDALGKHLEHTKVRNYDDFNEFFWRASCLAVPVDQAGARLHTHPKTYYEHRSIFTLVLNYYRIFHFNFMFLFMLAVLQYCVTISPRGGESGLMQFAALGQVVTPYSTTDLKLSLVFLVLAHALLSLFKGLLELAQSWHLLTAAFSSSTSSSLPSRLSYGSALALRLAWNGTFAALFYVMMAEGSGSGVHPWLDRFAVLGPVFLSPGATALVVTAVSPAVVRTSFWSKFVREGDSCYVGRNMTPPWSYRIVYIAFWVVLWLCKAVVSYWVLISPLMLPSLAIYDMQLDYKTHVVSVRNAGIICALWAPVFFVFCYDTQIYFTIFQAIYGAVKGMRMHTGEYHGFTDISRAFRMIPQRFDSKVVTALAVAQDHVPDEDGHRRSMLMARFVVVWNEVINFFREGDLLDDKEAAIFQYDVSEVTGEIYEPVFLSAGKVHQAMASVAKISRKNHPGQDAELSVELLLHDCNSALKSCFNAVLVVLEAMLGPADVSILEAFDLMEQLATQNKFIASFQTQHLVAVCASLVEFLEAVLDLPPPAATDSTLSPMQSTKAHPMPIVLEFVKRFHTFLHAMTLLCAGQPVILEKLGASHFCSPTNGYMAAAEGLVNLCANDAAMSNATRALLLLTLDTSDAMPRCSEAKRRLGFFMKSLMMDIPQLSAVKEMRSFSVMTPFYAEGVLYSLEELNAPLENHPIFGAVEEVGKNLTILKYLITIHTAEWENFLGRVDVQSEADARRDHPLELRLWASYRGQTLARTVQGMMLYEDAIKMLYWLEIGSAPDKSQDQKRQLLEDMVCLKFSYICACQVYGKHKAEGKAQATDMDYLLRTYPNLRVAFVDEAVDAANVKTFSSVLIKSEGDDIVEVYRYDLPGNPILGEGKPENQNNALPFTRGEFLQTIDMNQQHYYEECLKMPNLLVTADMHPSGQPVSIIGMREHIFTGNASSLSKFKSWQELVFVTLSQRVLADPLYCRMHYGHPDVFDKVMCLTRGGVSKASKGINLSEDVFAGFNTTLRGGVVTHVEFMQCGKGRDVALSQISMFEGKLANGAGETCLAREAHRMGAFLDFFRLHSMYYSHTGFYFATWLTIVTAFVFMYTKVYIALTGVQEQIVFSMNTTTLISQNSDKGFDARAFHNLDNIINTQYYIQAGLFLTLPLIAVYFTEAGIRRGFLRFFNMILTGGWAFFTFQVGTTSHYFDLNIVHGFAKYQATGRGFKITRETFVLLYKAYSGSHYRKAMELMGLCVIYGTYGLFSICQKAGVSEVNTFGQQFCITAQGYGTQTFAIWFISALWLLSPFLFNSDGFDYEKTKVDSIAWAKWMYATADDKSDLDKVNHGGWIGWWQGEVDQYIGAKGISRTTVIVRECRHLLVAWYVITLRYNPIVLLYTSLAVVATLGIFHACTYFKGLGALSSSVRATAYLLTVSLVLALYLVLTMVVLSKSAGDALAILYGYFAILYAVNEMARVCAFPTWSISTIGMFEHLAFLFDFLFGVMMLVPLVVLSVVPFMNIIQTRMMYNEGFSQVMSDSSQYAFSIAGMVGLVGAGACGWLYYVLTTLDFSGSFLAYTTLYDISIAPTGSTAYYVIAGAMGGSWLSAAWGFYFGRRATIFCGGVVAFVAMSLVSGTASFGKAVFLPSLVLFGCAIGLLLPAFCLYCYEISTRDMRPKIMLVLAVGFILGSMAASYYTHSNALVWMWQCFWCFLVLAFLTPVIMLLPESPYWVLHRLGADEAEACLVLLRRRTDVMVELTAMKESQAYRIPMSSSVYKAAVGMGLTIVLSLSLLPLNIYVARVGLGYGRALLLTNCLAVEFTFALFSFVYIDKFAHKMVLMAALVVSAVVLVFVASQDRFQLFGQPDQTALVVLFLVLYAVKGMGLPATMWVGFIGLFRTRGRVVSIPIYFTAFFGAHVGTTYIHLASPSTRTSASNEFVWLYCLMGASVVLVVGLFRLAKRSNGMLCTVMEMNHEREMDEARQRAPSHPRRRAYTSKQGSRRFGNLTLSPRNHSATPRGRAHSRKGSDIDTPYQQVTEAAV
ncbi:hypothetical protein DYB34_004832 [Aphanomyces astaci]|uniref:1,3-beta-glucan synthase n=1 Tax=Aphanomyces astaci TaxID=112090 RepID=A0A418BQ14_APHAT|nr:hypothetical protein DYB34_004832 [Aphanomyces astaci]